MAPNHMLWEGRSLPTTSGTSVCTGLVSFEVIFTECLRGAKKEEIFFTGVTVKYYWHVRYGWERTYRCS